MSKNEKKQPLYSLYIFAPDKKGDSCIELTSCVDTSAISYFGKSAMKDYIKFFSRTVVNKTQVGERQSVVLKENLGVAHAMALSDLRVIVLCGSDYPSRPAFELLSLALAAFKDQYPTWDVSNGNQNLPFPAGKKLFDEYKKVEQVDALARVQKKVDDTKDIALKTLEALCLNETDLEQLMQQSEDVNETSYQMYKTAKKANRCCGTY